jgi:hypothetical protein
MDLTKKGMTLDAIFNEKDTHDFFHKLSLIIDWDTDEELAKLPKVARMAVVVNGFDLEFCSAGLHPYLSNSSGCYFQEVQGYLFEIGAKRTSAIFGEVANLFPNNIVPNDRVQRGDALNSIGSSPNDCEFLDPYDEKIRESGENILELARSYLIQFKEEFRESSERFMFKI